VKPRDARAFGRTLASKLLEQGVSPPLDLTGEICRMLRTAVDAREISEKMIPEALRGAADHFESVASLAREAADDLLRREQQGAA
jgi:hypothetical protein